MPVAERFRGANVVDAGRHSPYWGEHAARYVFARNFVAGESVLDIACGTGFGLGLMNGVAKNVVGVDVDITAAQAAAHECARNSFVILANGLELPFPDKYFDVVISFETLEHLRDRSLFLAELKRVLRSKGLLVLSTPNANYTRPVNGKPNNPFHVHEYTPEELICDLETFFTVEQLFGQGLRSDFGIPPFHDAQVRLPRDIKTQSRLFGWKLLNKLPTALRETLSLKIWNAPFYPASEDYRFDEKLVTYAPVLVAVCHKS